MSTRSAAIRTVIFVAWRHLRERRLLNSIAVAGVALGVTVLIVMPALMSGYQVQFFEVMLKSSSHVVLHDTLLADRPRAVDGVIHGPLAAAVARQLPSDRRLRIERPREMVRALSRLEGVEAAAVGLSGTAVLEFGPRTRSVELRGIEPEHQERVTPLAQFLMEGRFSDLAVVPESVALGSGLARELGARVGDVLHAAAPGGRPLDLKVVAVFEVGIPPLDKVRGYALLRTTQTLLGRPDTVGRIDVRLRDPRAAVRAAQTFERLFGYEAESWQETYANFLTLFATQNVVIGCVIAALLAVGGFGILSVLSMIVLQKRRDVSILRSIGLRRREVRRVFMLQGVTLAALGSALGLLSGKALLLYIPTVNVAIEGVIKASSLPVHEDGRMYAWALGFALGIGALASSWPAWSAARVEPVEVLRGQIG